MNLELKRVTDIIIYVAFIFGLVTILSTSVSSLDSTDWGILTKLPLTYWMGLIALGFSILLTVRKGAINTRSLTVLVILVFFYFHLMPTIIEGPEGLSVFSLWPSSESNLLIAKGGLSIGNPNLLMDYSSWPLSIIFNSIILLITGLHLDFLAKWFPMFTLSFWSLLVFLILKKFFRQEYALVGVGLFLCGSWTRQQYLGPQSFAFSLFLLFMFFMTRSKQGFEIKARKFFGLAFITFIAILFSHALTSLSILLIIFSTYFAALLFARTDKMKNKSNFIFCLLCGVSALSYNLYFSPQFFSDAVQKMLDALSDFSTLKTIQQINRLPGSTFQQLTNLNIYLLVLAFVTISGISLIWMIRKRSFSKLQITFWIGYLFTLFIIAFLPYGEEGLFRAFIFGLPLFSILTIHLLKNRPLLLGSFLVFSLFTGLFAFNGSGAYRLATETELNGSGYCADFLPSGSNLFYHFHTYVRYNDQDTSFVFSLLGHPPFVDFNQSSVEDVLKTTDFIAISRNQRIFYEYYLGFDPFENVDLNGNLSLTRGRIYDNGNFTLYASKNHSIHR